MASLKNCPATELGPTHGIVLSDTIDTEALDRLVTTGESVSVAFSVSDMTLNSPRRCCSFAPPETRTLEQQ
ncbi:hypothetical protein HYG81_20065 (plasmid) [Natrinema zhouii]|uniref:HalOD1 output domain-containing protein n=1 Tax=Natrinema zhouii TaxID=1710539 RepID=UPI001E2DAC32|nr:HalOD1 output domain-containing protein [Natrinema zhouii]UHQ98416.1 hypothetical protein HYG81_20065 [Natrinema zhouii]